ncbi:helix-turn-helix transcriptional regulator [Flavobacterium sp. JLP]|uniref:helix-turn-helix domain-containing protein n=1 Tax=Flavobacterium sp. JLP TaxID=2783793 RepID=UPI00188B4E56|nr:AraC family transcriptional regulator [Flavobacterium sp. JLP]MBF4505364.1 helix-turn-helix transcriptional regulator [Flavobacterium sp. JLP]
MDYVLMPDKIAEKENTKPKLSFVPYVSDAPLVKGKSRLTQHMISLIMQGEKHIYSDGKPIQINPANILLLSAGNYIFTERPNGNPGIRSILVFFDDEFLQDAVRNNIKFPKNASKKTPNILVPKDDYLNNFISTVQSLIYDPIFTESMQVAKLNELLVYLCLRFPEELNNFQNVSIAKTPEERIQNVAQQNIFNNFSVSELAFFCHMSVSTFKRKFQKIYNEKPAKWMQEQRLITAAALLKNGSKPSEIYLKAGYENHSSFSKAFKSHFGKLPKNYS